MRVTVDRYYLPDVTLSRVYVYEIGNFVFQCLGAENPWHDNAQGQSCIPAGRYRMKRDFYNRGGYEAFEVLDVPNRSEIKIHIGNGPADVLGCLVVGKTPMLYKGVYGVASSTETYSKFMAALAGVETCGIDFRWTVPPE